MTDDERLRLDRNQRTFTRLVGRCEREVRRGRAERAAVCAMTAATYAWCNPTGTFASLRLEGLIGELAGRLAPVAPSPPDPAGGRRQVLHVVTQLYGTGGHTQMLANWLRLDDARDHHVCVTGQEGRPLPEKITGALASADRITLLDEPFCGLLDRARALRRQAADYDHVVLHIHPNDVVACLALAGRPWGSRVGAGPEVLLVNHADHVFWLGATVADRVVNLRVSGERLNLARRGIPDRRNAQLVRPLHLRPREHARADARARLGIGADEVVAVSAADTYKYRARPGEGLLDALLPFLRATPGARLHVAGPGPEGEWSILAQEGLGRAWGLLPDIRTLLEAADIYLDSYPFSSLTSMLEAASLDLPVLTWRPDDRLGVLCADTPELDDHLVVAPTADALAGEVAALAADPAGRRRLGRATGDAVRRAHAEGAWAAQVEKLLAASADRRPEQLFQHPVRDTGALDRRLLAVMEPSVGHGRTGTLAVLAPVLRWPERVVAAALLLRQGRVRPALLLPAAVARRLRGWAARLRPAAG